MDIPAYREKNLANIQKENDKKLLWSLVESEREKKVLKKLFEQVKFEFLKKLMYNFRLIKNQFRLIETDISSQKILKEISIDRKQIGSIENMEKQNFRKNQPDF